MLKVYESYSCSQEFALASACGPICLAHESESVSALVSIRDDSWYIQ